MRVYELAKELGISAPELLVKLTEIGEFVRSSSSVVSPAVAEALRGNEPRVAAVFRESTAAKLSIHEAADAALAGLLREDSPDYNTLRVKAIDGLVALYQSKSATVPRERARLLGIQLGGDPARFSDNRRWVTREIPSGAPGLGKRS